MCGDNGLNHGDCELCVARSAYLVASSVPTQRHSIDTVCPQNILLNTACAAYYNAGGDWGYNGPMTGQASNYLNAYPQHYVPPQADAHDPNFLDQPPSTTYYDTEAVGQQTVDPSQLRPGGANSTSAKVDALYPPGVASHMDHRSRLFQLLESACIRNGTPDDAVQTKHFFTKTEGNPGVLYWCTVEGCDSSFNRLDRATNHFRTHIQHRPFVCGGCDKPNCTERFYSNETRKAHMHKNMASCECGSYLESKNLKRHQQQAKSCKVRTPEE